MNQRVIIPLLVAMAFGAGFGARIWTEKDASLPPPPALGSEFVHSGSTTAPAPKPDTKPDAKPAGPRPTDRAKLIADIERYWEQIEIYQKRMDEIEADFERDFVAILDPEQRRQYDASKKEKSGRYGKMQAQPRVDYTLALMTDEQIEKSKLQPLLRALDTVAITPRLNFVNRVYKLSEAQQMPVRQILTARREKFLKLIDEISPPSIQLTRLAPLTQKLIAPQATPPAK